MATVRKALSAVPLALAYAASFCLLVLAAVFIQLPLALCCAIRGTNPNGYDYGYMREK